MTEIVNLNKARKARLRAEDAARAAANRVRFGRTRSERDRTRLDEARARAALDGQRLSARGDEIDDRPAGGDEGGREFQD